MNLNIRSERVRKGLSVEELSEQIKVSPSTVYSWEQGKRPMTFDDVIALADFFDCSADYLAGRTDERTVRRN